MQKELGIVANIIIVVPVVSKNLVELSFKQFSFKMPSFFYIQTDRQLKALFHRDKATELTYILSFSVPLLAHAHTHTHQAAFTQALRHTNGQKRAHILAHIPK